MEFNINDTVYTIMHELDVLKGTVIDKIDEGDRFKYIVMFKLLTDDNKEYETSNVFYEWNLFESEEKCLQREYDREKASIESALTYLNQVKEKLDKIKGATCRNCINFCPTCKRCKAAHPAIAEDMIDRVDLIKCYFYKRKGE